MIKLIKRKIERLYMENYRNVKNPSSVEDQIEKLKLRGCIIEDEAKATRTLEQINYYRLAHYFKPFLKDKKTYFEGTSFNKVLRIYDFDRFLRFLVLEVLEEIEISLRACVSNYHSRKYGSTGYLNPSTFDVKHNQQSFMNKIERMIDANNEKEFVIHHKKKYGGAFPLWVIMELFSFGTLSFFFSDMKVQDKKEVADKYYNINYRLLENWIFSLSDLRNHCAHYNRLYANTIGQIPKVPEDIGDFKGYKIKNTLFDYLLISKQLYLRNGNWDERILKALLKLSQSYSDVIKLCNFGFPDNWLEMLSK